MDRLPFAAAVVSPCSFVFPSEIDNNNNSTTASATRTSSVRPVPITPEKRPRPQQQRSNNNNNERAQKKAKVKREPGVVRSNISDPSNDEKNINEFAQWVRNIHVGSKGGPISEANARSVLNRVRDLVSGRGITCKNWPSGIMFHPEVVTLQTNFMALLTRAKAFEDRYGRDTGYGWLLQHPIKKLALYKKYIEDKRPYSS